MIPGIVAGAAFGESVPETDYDPLWQYVVFLMHGEGADGSQVFQDKSKYARAVTTVGAAQADTDIVVGDIPSIKFDSDSNYVWRAWGHELNIALSAPDFCFECYAYFTDLAPLNDIYGRRRNSNNFKVYTSGSQLVFATYSGTTQTTRLAVTHGMTAGNVYHIAIIRVGTTYYGFIDGVLVGSGTSGGGSVGFDTSTGLYLGQSETDQSSRYMRGNLNWMRITMGHPRYDVGGFDPPDVPLKIGGPPPVATPDVADFDLVSALISFDGADDATVALDESTYGRAISFVGNAKLDNAHSRFGTTALALDGSGDYVSMANAAELSVGGTTNFCIEAWVYLNTTTGVHTISSKRDGSAADEHHLFITGGKVAANLFNTGSSVLAVSSDGPDGSITAGTWNHIAFTRVGNYSRLFVNGKLVAAGTQMSAPSTNSGPLLVGWDVTSSGYYLNGYISEYRFTKGAAIYTETFTPPDAPFARSSAPLEEAPNPSFANVVLLSGFEGADGATTATGESSSAQTITFVNDAQIDTAQFKFGSSSLLCLGSDDYCSVPHDAEVSISGKDEFTVEAWIRPTATALGKAQSLIVNKRDGSGAEEYWLALYAGKPAFVTFASGSTSSQAQADDALVADTWNHIVGMKNGSNYYVFVNGLLAASAIGGSPSGNTAPVLIGRDGYSGGREFDGWIDEVRISLEAFYPTTGFLVPAGAFPRS